jgi:hypothetical protein
MNLSYMCLEVAYQATRRTVRYPIFGHHNLDGSEGFVVKSKE